MPSTYSVTIQGRAHSVSAADPLRRPHLTLEAPAELDVLGELGGRDLDRHRRPAAGEREVDGAHPALADPVLQPVRADQDGVLAGERCEHRAPSREPA
jgi:hypothetical protein